MEGNMLGDFNPHKERGLIGGWPDGGGSRWGQPEGVQLGPDESRGQMGGRGKWDQI